MWRRCEGINGFVFPELPNFLLILSSKMPTCGEDVCFGSVMMPTQHVRKPDDARTKEELLPLATDFIDQYYTSIKRQEPLRAGLKQSNGFFSPLVPWGRGNPRTFNPTLSDLDFSFCDNVSFILETARVTVQGTTRTRKFLFKSS